MHDEYEDLLNTIEAETNQQEQLSSATKKHMRMSQNSLAGVTGILQSRVTQVSEIDRDADR